MDKIPTKSDLVRDPFEIQPQNSGTIYQMSSNLLHLLKVSRGVLRLTSSNNCKFKPKHSLPLPPSSPLFSLFYTTLSLCATSVLYDADLSALSSDLIIIIIIIIIIVIIIKRTEQIDG